LHDIGLRRDAREPVASKSTEQIVPLNSHRPRRRRPEVDKVWEAIALHTSPEFPNAAGR